MMRKVLGRGLGALIADKEDAGQKGERARERINYVNIQEIRPNRYQPRAEFNKEKQKELALSIKEKGIVQPILIRPSGDGYELIAGERRLRAVRSLGFKEIPAIIKAVDDINALELSLIENIQREELNPIEEARAYQRLLDEFSFTQEKVGEAVGRERATVANSLRLLALPKLVQEHISKGLLSVGHAKVILSAADNAEQIALSKRVIRKGLSVRALENIVRKKGPAKKRGIETDNDTRMIEEKIQERLGTKVRISRGKKRGTIEIEYYSDEDLNRILRVLGCASI